MQGFEIRGEGCIRTKGANRKSFTCKIVNGLKGGDARGRELLSPGQAAALSGPANQAWEERKQGFESAKGRFYCALVKALLENI